MMCSKLHKRQKKFYMGFMLVKNDCKEVSWYWLYHPATVDWSIKILSQHHVPNMAQSMEKKPVLFFTLVTTILSWKETQLLVNGCARGKRGKWVCKKTVFIVAVHYQEIEQKPMKQNSLLVSEMDLIFSDLPCLHFMPMCSIIFIFMTMLTTNTST